MKSFRQSIVLLFAISILLLLTMPGCSSSPATITSSTVPKAVITADLSGYSTEIAATLNSLEKITPYPFYVMHYVGEYNYPVIGSHFPKESDYSCSLFASLGEGEKYFGRNFDWDFSPTLLLFTDPPGGYASTSMVDLTFLGISDLDARKLDKVPLAERMALLSAPSMPFDGMNEYGLTIGMAALDEEYLDDASYDPARPDIGSIGIIRQVLDHARNVDEAVEFFNQYNIDFSGGPPIHYLLADRSGKSILIEFYQGEMIQLPNQAAWHMATNHLRYTAEGDGGCERYHTLADRLSTLNGKLNAADAMQLLSDVKQPSTQWSTVYNMTNGNIDVVNSWYYDDVHSFHLDLVNP